MKNSKFRIVSLKDRPGYAAICAHWTYGQWYIKRDIPFDVTLKAYERRAMSEILPCTFVACVDSYPVGMVNLKEKDLWSRTDLDIWLSSLYVMPGYRKTGVGGMLVNRVIERAGELGYSRIYLFLAQSEIQDLAAYYRKRGWKYFDDAIDNDGEKTAVYCYDVN